MTRSGPHLMAGGGCLRYFQEKNPHLKNWILAGGFETNSFCLCAIICAKRISHLGHTCLSKVLCLRGEFFLRCSVSLQQCYSNVKANLSSRCGPTRPCATGNEPKHADEESHGSASQSSKPTRVRTPPPTRHTHTNLHPLALLCCSKQKQTQPNSYPHRGGPARGRGCTFKWVWSSLSVSWLMRSLFRTTNCSSYSFLKENMYS